MSGCALTVLYFCEYHDAELHTSSCTFINSFIHLPPSPPSLPPSLLSSLMSQLSTMFSGNRTPQVILEPVIRAGMEAIKV